MSLPNPIRTKDLTKPVVLCRAVGQPAAGTSFVNTLAPYRQAWAYAEFPRQALYSGKSTGVDAVFTVRVEEGLEIGVSDKLVYLDGIYDVLDTQCLEQRGGFFVSISVAYKAKLTDGCYVQVDTPVDNHRPNPDDNLFWQ